MCACKAGIVGSKHRPSHMQAHAQRLLRQLAPHAAAGCQGLQSNSRHEVDPVGWQLSMIATLGGPRGIIESLQGCAP